MEGIKEEVVLSPAHALSLIASGEGKLTFTFIFQLLMFPYKVFGINFRILFSSIIFLWLTAILMFSFNIYAEHRHVGSNNFNLLSSRSHTIFTLVLQLLLLFLRFCAVYSQQKCSFCPFWFFFFFFSECCLFLDIFFGPEISNGFYNSWRLAFIVNIIMS